MFEKNTSRYTYVAIVLHWTIAALILFMIWLGWNMDDNEARYQLHKSIGISILLLTVARIIWRRMNPPPRLPDEMPQIERRASHFVHMAFYFLMIATPLAGWLLVSISKFQVPTVLFGVVSWPHLPFTSGLRGSGLEGVVEFLHSKSAWLFIGLLVLHVAGAVKHQFIGDSPVLKRMLPGLLGPTRPPRYGAYGHLQAFGTAALLFGLIIAVPFVGGVLGKVKSSFGADRANIQGETQDATATPRMEPNWAVDYDASEIRFSGIHDGKPFSGVFKNWTADVAFDPSRLEDSEVNVTVETGSATTGRKLYDDSLRAEEWLHVSTFDEAKVRLSEFRETNAGYTATATLSLKGQVVEVPLDFTLNINGNIATLAGETKLTRTRLKLGYISDPSAQWVSEDIIVTVSGIAYEIAPGSTASDLGIAPMPDFDPAPIDAARIEDPVSDDPASALPSEETPLFADTPAPSEETFEATEPVEALASEGRSDTSAAGAPLADTGSIYDIPVEPDFQYDDPVPAPVPSSIIPAEELVLDEYTLRQLTKKPEPEPSFPDQE